MEVAMSNFPTPPLAALLALVALAWAPAVASEAQILGDYTAANPRIDFKAYLGQAESAQQVRERNRLSEAKFIELSRMPEVVILDARSRDKFELLHVAGAVNLPFADISEPSLAKTLPDKDQVILIYCNNNFDNAPVAMESKRLSASLNISTFIALHTYGYKRIYELGPLLDVHTTVIPLVGERR
jgi:phage shock protein E